MVRPPQRLSTGDPELDAALDGVPDEALADILMGMPADYVQPLRGWLGDAASSMPHDPLRQAIELDPAYLPRQHLEYLSERLRVAIAEVKAGRNRRIAISLPPRAGKTTLTSTYLPVWCLRQQPTWKIGLISHAPTLATSWSRAIRQAVEQHGTMLGLKVAPDAGAVSEWQTTQRGGVIARSAPGQSIVGLGFNILIIDDIVKDYASAHSENAQRAIWDWWIGQANTRLEDPYLVIVIGTRWSMTDFIGRVLSPEFEGDPADWEVINIPAIAEAGDVLGRQVGEPLLSPFIKGETPEAALARWASLERTVGAYNWEAQFQGRPTSPQGAIFDLTKFRYWTTDPARATEDGQVRYVEWESMLHARWIDSWDMAFKGTESSDYVVGQRWVRHGANRFLVDQRRGQWSFTKTLAQVTDFMGTGVAHDRVYQRYVEDKANGPAIIETLHDKIAGLLPVDPKTGKEARARAITPEIESGNVYLPHPSEYSWVLELVSELRSFPRGSHDDSVDALTQALAQLRDEGRAQISNPGDRPLIVTPNRAAAARTGIRR